jgi:large subunit ribosomal protein L4
MAKIKLFNQAGSSVKNIELNDAVFGIEPNTQAMFDAVLTYRASLRQGTHSTKNRSAVRGGGRKPWRQKGTGRARQGSIRSPQWRGGGVVFGPTPKKYKLKMNRKVRALALKSAYSAATRDKKLLGLESLSFQTPKTKEFAKFLMDMKLDGKVLVILAHGSDAENTFVAGRNIANVAIMETNEVAVEDLLYYDTIIMTQDAIKMVEEVLA